MRASSKRVAEVRPERPIQLMACKSTSATLSSRATAALRVHHFHIEAGLLGAGHVLSDELFEASIATARIGKAS